MGGVVMTRAKGRRSLRCQPVTLSDGTVVYARSRGELTDEDRAALETFNQLLKDKHQEMMDGNQPEGPRHEP